jgi:hypothetical protein
MGEKPASQESSKFKAGHTAWLNRAKQEAGPVAMGSIVAAMGWNLFRSVLMFNPYTSFLGAAVAAIAGYGFYKAADSGNKK